MKLNQKEQAFVTLFDGYLLSIARGAYILDGDVIDSIYFTPEHVEFTLIARDTMSPITRRTIAIPNSKIRSFMYSLINEWGITRQFEWEY